MTAPRRFERVCFYCLLYMNEDGYRLLNERDPDKPQLRMVDGRTRCDYCDMRERGKLYWKPPAVLHEGAETIERAENEESAEK